MHMQIIVFTRLPKLYGFTIMRVYPIDLAAFTEGQCEWVPSAELYTIEG